MEIVRLFLFLENWSLKNFILKLLKTILVNDIGALQMNLSLLLSALLFFLVPGTKCLTFLLPVISRNAPAIHPSVLISTRSFITPASTHYLGVSNSEVVFLALEWFSSLCYPASSSSPVGCSLHQAFDQQMEHHCRSSEEWKSLDSLCWLGLALPGWLGDHNTG